jgi:ABC-type sugar transport system ATPase subunit
VGHGGIQLENLYKNYGAVAALRDIDLSIAEGEFFVLLGPSGCGKTTLLRAVAGVASADSGLISLGGETVFSSEAGVDTPPKERGVGMVFQNYALYPHMTVEKNVAFGLKMRKTARAEIKGRVSEALRLVGLEGFESRLPRQLSGGQQQRVAVARTIVTGPRFLLFDEPLSSLDPMLRVNLRSELLKVHRAIGATSLYVTHDQTEAMVLADRIGVLDKGRLVQVDTAGNIYHFPATVDVAEFTGRPKTNILRGEVHKSETRTLFIPEDDPYCFIPLEKECAEYAGETVYFHVRPDNVTLEPAAEEDEGRLEVLAIMPEGADVFIHLRLGDRQKQMLARVSAEEAAVLSRGQHVGLRFRRGNVYDLASGRLRGSFGIEERLTA